MPTKQTAPMANQDAPKSEAETNSVHAKPPKTDHFATSLETSPEHPSAPTQHRTVPFGIREPARPIEKATSFETIAPSPGLPAITSAANSPATIAPFSHTPTPISTVPLHIKSLLSVDKPSTLELTLAPEELGKLRLVMVPEGDKIRIVIQAERPETLELLRRNTENFASDLRQSGYTEASFSFSGWNDQPPSTPIPKDERATHFSGGAEETPTKSKLYTAQIKGTGLDLRV
jgi:flagellar hook-length control protein FliK